MFSGILFRAEEEEEAVERNGGTFSSCFRRKTAAETMAHKKPIEHAVPTVAAMRLESTVPFFFLLRFGRRSELLGRSALTCMMMAKSS
jgi:hypothetical protein